VYFKQILNEEGGCSSYVIASRQSGDAAVIDPAIDIEPYVELATRRGFKIKLAIDTHIHADHVSGARKLAAATGAEVAMHASADVLFPFRGLQDGEKIALGQLILEVMHTPGHRPEAISIAVTNPPRGDHVSMVLTGDSLFVGDVGRPDFGGARGAEQQYESVHRLLGLGDFVEVFPAHFEGSCGKGMCGRPSSTIGFERLYNPLLQLDRGAFVAAATEAPARPLNMTAIIATNRGEGDYAWAQPRTVDQVATLSASDAPAWISQHAPAILDVREPAEYATGHLPAALSIPQAELASRLAELDRDREYLVVCAGGVRSIRAAHYLRAQGFDRVTSLDGGTDGWRNASLPIEGDTGEARPASTPERYIHAAPMA
jgi:glyoxylase-like metal-dependent hydrolase (beta-lactamase superfamily II)/rhodanese-related sulfurtransferase